MPRFLIFRHSLCMDLKILKVNEGMYGKTWTKVKGQYTKLKYPWVLLLITSNTHFLFKLKKCIFQYLPVFIQKYFYFIKRLTDHQQNFLKNILYIHKSQRSHANLDTNFLWKKLFFSIGIRKIVSRGNFTLTSRKLYKLFCMIFLSQLGNI